MKLTKTIISSSSLALLLVLSAPVARAALGISFTTTADVTTAIPGGTGTFTNFPTAPAVSNGAVSFLGYGVNGQQGCYILLPPNPIMPLADLNTAVPNGTGNFTDFDLTDLSLSGTSLAFIGAGSGSQLGVYVAAPTDPYRVIADLNTTIPGGSGFFTNFLPPNPILPTAASISGSNVAFIGYGDLSQIGVYAKYGTDLPSVVADLNTPIPGGTGNFTGFLPPNPIVPPNPVISGDVIAFLGFGSAGQQGIYRFLPPNPIMPDGSLTSVADTTTAIPGSTVSGSTFGYFHNVSMENANIAFVGGAVGVCTSDGCFPDQQGVYKDIGSGWQPVADLNTTVPGTGAVFQFFGTVAIDPGYVVFDAFDDSGVYGLYTDFGGGLHKIVATGDTINGKVLSDFSWSQFGFSAQSAAQVAFTAEFTDGSQAVTIATLTNGPCPLTQGYWKNHPNLWPVSSLTLGTQTYSQPELLNILRSSTNADASMILARQLIAAKLNIANGSDGTPVSGTITDADSLLSNYAGKLPYGVTTSSSDGQAMVSDANILDAYNNGQLTQFCGP